MMIFDELYDGIKDAKERKDKGEYNSILPPFPRLAEKYPGWVKGRLNLITASSGIGKTKFTKFFAVESVVKFMEANPYLSFKMFYFALEESKEEFWLSVLSILLRQKYGITASTSNLRSLGTYVVSQEILDKIKECKEIVDGWSSKITVIDDVSNEFGIYKEVRTYFQRPEVGEEIKTKMASGEEFVSGYKYKDDRHWVFVVTDHISLLSINKGQTLHDTMGHFSKEYCLKGLCKRYKAVVINIQQQSASKEAMEFNFKGDTIEQKLEPSLDGLANNKEIQRDVDLCIGIFAPNRYSIKEHRKYDITIMKDWYRSIIFLKDRHFGLAGSYIGLYFDGATNEFRELPKADDKEKLQKVYEYIKSKSI